MFLMFVEHPDVTLTEQIIHIFGIPGIIAGLVWLVRSYDRGQRQIAEIHASSKETERVSAEIKSGIDTIQTNHLEHLAEGIKNLDTGIRDSNTTLTSIDSNIAILVDRGKRSKK